MTTPIYTSMAKSVEAGHLTILDPFNDVMVWYVHPETGEETLVDRLPQEYKVVWHESVSRKVPEDVRVLYEDDPCIRMKYVVTFDRVSTKAFRGAVQVLCSATFDAERERMVGVIEKVYLHDGLGKTADVGIIKQVEDAFVKLLTDPTMGEKVFLAQVDDLWHNGKVYKLL